MSLGESNMPDIQQIGNMLSKDNFSKEDKLEAVRSIKNLFRYSHKTFSHINLETLLKNAISLQNQRRCDKDFLCGYGMCLVDFLKQGEEVEIYKKIITEIMFVLKKLTEIDEKLGENFVEKIWLRLERVFICDSDFVAKILEFSKNFFEKIVADWLEGVISVSQKNYLIVMSSDSPELFQTITAIFYQIIILSNGSSKILEETKSFVDSVLSICVNERKDFLNLYPIDCRHVVTSLLVSPDHYKDQPENEKFINLSWVKSLLVDLYSSNSKRTLMLMSHFPEWLPLLRNSIEAYSN